MSIPDLISRISCHMQNNAHLHVDLIVRNTIMEHANHLNVWNAGTKTVFHIKLHDDIVNP